MTEKDVMEYIGSLQGRGIVPGLEGIRELCRRLGNPQDALSFVHIAGTNGKGSTLAFVSTVLKCAGYKVGRYLSPTIFHYRERIQVGGRPISKAALCEGIELVQGVCEEMVREGWSQPTAFEVETALAFWYFHKKACDIVVLEAGMGGSLDATNIVTTTVTSVITSVGMDHMKFLGNTLREIALQKAGVIKEGCPVVLLEQSEEVSRVVEQAAGEKGARLIVARGSDAVRIRSGLERQRFDYGGLKGLEISLAGTFQIDNAVLAIETIRTLAGQGYSVKEEALRRGLRETVWRGRFSVLRKNPLFVVDGAHNEDAAQKLAQTIEIYFTNRRIIYIMGVLKDKEYEKIIDLTHKYADQIITVTPPDNPRAMHAYELAREIARVHPLVTAVDSLEEAVEMSLLLAGKEDVILAFGSLSYLGRLMEIVTR
ncbi:MAG: bifunctional folylpolyglutamate synthase/dihydrofolate synthase [Candidatus Gastranaerophilales bacterium]|nr:bifunctional folylpolyglutamate synthase/dihydrofolate synthase [Candidatus Gastranaerophilales bacterium]